MAVIRWLLVIVMVMHGIGHIMGFLAAWTKIPVGWRDAPWLLGGGYHITSPVGAAWGLLWLVVLIGFVGAGLGLIWSQPWWLALAVASAVVSLVAILPWWTSAPLGAAVGGVVVDLVILWLASPLGAPMLERIVSKV